ncbi:MAG: diacylglycerol kinase [Gammaproteobacteria bacterium]
MNQSPYKGKTGLQRIWNALQYSLQGFRSAYEHESAFRQELFLGVILAGVALVLPVTRTQLGLLLASLLLVLITELLNSAIEAVVDRVSFENHELAKRAKDMGSAAVFLSLANCLLIWGLVLMDVFQIDRAI